MEWLTEFIDIALSNDILLYLGMLIEGVVSIFLWKKQKQPKSTGTIVTEDLQALVDYHKNVAKKLEEKITKGG